MDEAEQLQAEEELYSAIVAAFIAAGGVMSLAMQSIRPILEKHLEETQRAAVIALLLLMADDLPPIRTYVDDLDRDERKLAKLEKQIRKSAKRQAKAILKGMRKTNKKRKGSEWLLGEDRAEAIAITEITRAISRGEEFAAGLIQKQGVLLECVWWTAQDERVCPICGELHGRIELFWVDEYPDGPPAHVRCRCRKRWRVRK